MLLSTLGKVYKLWTYEIKSDITLSPIGISILFVWTKQSSVQLANPAKLGLLTCIEMKMGCAESAVETRKGN